jgi:hypothetical protein
MVQGMEIYNAAAREVAGVRHVPFIDFAAAVPKTPEYFGDDVHMKKSGNVILAQQAAAAIEAAGLVPAAVSPSGRAKR